MLKSSSDETALRERDEFEAAAVLFKRALTTTPNYVQEHVEYIRTRASMDTATI